MSASNVETIVEQAFKAADSDPAKAARLLHAALDQNPDHSSALYLLGMLHAKLGLHEKATEELARATSLDDKLPKIAYFKLGFLYLLGEQLDKANDAWKALKDLPNDHYLNCFSKGLISMLEARYEDCIGFMEKGIQNNAEHEDLNRDMNKVLVDAKEQLSSPQ